MVTDSCEYDAAEELLPPNPGKHRTTDSDVEPLKRHKYDENYCTLIWGSLILEVVPFLSHIVFICAKVLYHN